MIVRFLLLILISNFAFQIFPQQSNKEFRSTWVITWEYISGSSSVEQNKARIRQILDNHKAANMTSVLWQVRQAGTAYYPSSYEPWGSYAGGSNPGFDPLQYAIEEAHKRGLELHAWFNVFATASTAPGSPAQQNPNWVCRDQLGNPMTSNRALSPGLQAVREYTARVAMEIVRNYDIDGFHLDYIRWNEYTSSTNSEKFAQFQNDNKLLDGEITEEQITELITNAQGRYLYDVEHPYSAGVPSGYNSWPHFWRSSVTKMVQMLHDSIQAVKPWVRLSAAALGKYNWSGWQGYDIVYQDAALWFNEGYIDQLTPMHYHWTTGPAFYGMLQGSCPECWSQFIQPGIQAGRLYTVGPGSYILSDQNRWNNHPEIVNSSRTVNWVDGFQFFSYGSWRDKAYFNEAGQTFFNKKTKIRSAKFLLDTIPDVPTISILKIDSLNYQLTITPPPTATTNQWFALYRSEDANINVDNDEIREIFFGNQPIIRNETYNGLQDYNGIYYYSATMLDRYWNESLPSNVVQTDAIPSFAPKVSATTPSEGDTIQVNSVLSITFSKRMNKTSVQNALSIVPSVTISNFVWTLNDTKLTLTIPSQLAFATNYVLTVDTSAKDVNGRKIDGNGDGIEGDPFVLNFSTVDQDLTGPIVVYSNLWGDELDIDDVVSVVFDELINHATVNHNSVKLTNSSGTGIAKDIRIYNIKNQSIINLRTPQPLLPNTGYMVELTEQITDVYGNPKASSTFFQFNTSNMEYSNRTMIDDFTNEGFWEQPQYSGSTVGIGPNTSFGYDTQIALPATTPVKSAYIQYEWNPNANNKLLREYLSNGPPRDVEFDTTYYLQAYVFGDGSGNRFRFCVDEGVGTTWPYHEVSRWYKIDWFGWKLLEWKLSDSSMVGTWIGNGVLDGTNYRTDSFQMTDDQNSDIMGRIYIDNYRIAKKTASTTSISENIKLPDNYLLHQNYPNPFNPSTIINYQLVMSNNVKLKVYDILGNEVATLVNEFKEAGEHSIKFDTELYNLAGGVYIYTLQAGEYFESKKMLLIK